MTEAELKNRLRQALPVVAFARRPWRLVWLLPILGIIGLSAWIAFTQQPRVLKFVMSFTAGNAYASLMFLGHEVAHGAVVRSRRIQNSFLSLAGFIFLLPPGLWRQWHNVAHHAHTNLPSVDPDNFGDISHFPDMRWGRWLLRIAPGHGRWFGPAFLLLGFTLQAQGVLWLKSRRWSTARLNRPRTAACSGAMAVVWAIIAYLSGWPAACYVVAIPMVVANAIVMSYIITNHWVRPLCLRRDTLATSMSVRTWPVIDRIHFHFSHHVEHHLFPALGSNYYPLVRASLCELVRDRYICPSHYRALIAVFSTPRLYSGLDMLSYADGSQDISIRHLEIRLSDMGKGLAEKCDEQAF